jgi:hypothetical protein
VRKGALVAMADGKASAYALADLAARGTMFVAPGDAVYAGMLVGESSTDDDLQARAPLRCLAAPGGAPPEQRCGGASAALRVSAAVAVHMSRHCHRGHPSAMDGPAAVSRNATPQRQRACRRFDLCAARAQVNPCREKKLSNVRSKQADEKIIVPPPRLLTLEEAIGYVQPGELLEVTPAAVRLRKEALGKGERRRGARGG